SSLWLLTEPDIPGVSLWLTPGIDRTLLIFARSAIVASLRDIRRRIRSVRSTAQITKAMELVAASRMRRAQLRVLASRPYAEAMRTFIAELAAAGAGQGADELHPLLEPREVDTVGTILLTTDRGLGGGVNT